MSDSSIITKEAVVSTVVVTKKVALVSSDKIAEIFGKRHDNVLKMINKSINSLLQMEESISKYYLDSSYTTSRNKTYPRFNLTRKGFDLVALSFTGEKAFKYKVYYIDAFHDKDALIKKHKLIAKTNSLDEMWVEFRQEGKVFRKKLTNAINDTVVKVRHDEEGKMNDGRFFHHYTTLLYKKLGITLPKGAEARDTLDKRMLVRLEDLEDQVADMLREYEKEGVHYKEVYKKVKNRLLASAPLKF